MTVTRELVTNDILVTWAEGEETPSSLLSSLNVCLEFLSGYDRYLAHSAGWDCELNLVLEGMEERGFRFSLSCSLIPSSQLYLGQGEAYADILSWLKVMHEELLERMLSFSNPEELDELLVRARNRAAEAHLDRELLFSFERSRRKLVSLERRFGELLKAREELAGKVSLKILEK
ncbi:MAG: hypothetical protein PQJ60_14190 [Spirochaetales bacterium]|nr:hypothetical protein [Spirochaetales bacterium]